MHITHKDIKSALITGLTTGFLTWRILVFLGVEEFAGISLGFLIVVVPLLWLFGIWLGYFLGRWIPFFRQFGKFAAIGFTNAAVDFGVLYFFIATSNVASGLLFTFFKSASFLVALIHSYLWNKYWAFEATKNGANVQEFGSFAAVAIVSLVVNVSIASMVVNYIGGPYFDLDVRAWAGVGAVAGSAASLILSFLGFKLLVFRK